jgi:hypothetical protein
VVVNDRTTKARPASFREGGARGRAVKVVRPVGRSTCDCPRGGAVFGWEVGRGLGGGGGGPELGGAAGGERALTGGAALGGECGKRLLETLGGEVALAEIA